MSDFYQKYRSIINFCLGVLCFTLAVKLTPKSLSITPSTSSSSSEGKLFIIFFIIGLLGGLIGFFTLKGAFFKKTQPVLQRKEKKILSKASPGTYQYLIDETETYKAELKKCKTMVIACVCALWTLIWLGKWSGHPFYSNETLISLIFIIAFIIVGFFSVQKERELDTHIADCIIQGIELEKKTLSLRSSYFHGLAKYYEGWGMLAFVFVRISPLLWLFYSGIRAGGLQTFNELFSHTSFWTTDLIAWLIFGICAVFLGLIASHPYEDLLKKQTPHGEK